MTLELRVLSGTRAGERAHFETPVVTIGRHAMSDLRFDPNEELDVSTRHAELRNVNGAWSVSDQGSTNGTFLNGERIAAERGLSEGDIMSFGANGPRIEVRGIGVAGMSPPTPRTSVQSELAPTGAPAAPRLDTSVRVAAAVKEQTKSMRRVFIGAGAAFLAVAAAGIVYWQRQVSAREHEMATLFAQTESSVVALQKKIDGTRPGDAAYAAALKDSLEAVKREVAHTRAQIAAGTATAGTVSELSKKLDRTALMQQSLSQMDLTKVVERNDPAVAMLASDFDGKFLAGTAFGISADGLMITNKHVVKSESGAVPQRLMVIFANTNKWLKARIVRVSDEDDLALLQVEGAGSYPMVAGVSRAGALARVGAPVASIGFPGATETPMEGTGMNITARTTSTPGTVSKRLDDVIQIDSYAGHGSSGSPLFDSAGLVVGVIYGGAKESNGRIVYAVPAQRLSAFIGSDGGAIVK